MAELGGASRRSSSKDGDRWPRRMREAIVSASSESASAKVSSTVGCADGAVEPATRLLPSVPLACSA